MIRIEKERRPVAGAFEQMETLYSSINAPDIWGRDGTQARRQTLADGSIISVWMASLPGDRRVGVHAGTDISFEVREARGLPKLDILSLQMPSGLVIADEDSKPIDVGKITVTISPQDTPGVMSALIDWTNACLDKGRLIEFPIKPAPVNKSAA